MWVEEYNEQSAVDDMRPDDSVSHITDGGERGQVGRAIAPFDPDVYNSDSFDIYIKLEEGDAVEITKVEKNGWAYGFVERPDIKVEGWFPRDFVDVGGMNLLSVANSTSRVGNADGSSVASAFSFASSVGWVSHPQDCFAPETMFMKHAGLPNLMYERVSAMFLAVEDQVLAANGVSLTRVVRKVRHEDQRVLEVRVDDARLRVTPTHRVSVPADNGELTEVCAKDLQVGDQVMVSDGSRMPITEIIPVSEPTHVLAFTFEPDIPISTYFPPNLSIVSLGQRPRTHKPTRRGGYSRKSCDVFSIPDTDDGAWV